MKFKWLSLLGFILISIHTTSLAHPIDLETAQAKAVRFLNQRHSRSTDARNLRLDFRSHSTYLFSNGSHFALMSADDELPEVLGYGIKKEGELPPALVEYMQAHKQYRSATPRTKFKPVKPLVPFVRHQGSPYFNHCPFYKKPSGTVTPYHCQVGCVATALEQIISYYRREVVLLDTLHGWSNEKYTIEDILPGTKVDCKLIRDNYANEDYTEEEVDAVSRLSYYCGVAAHMNWGLNASGANIQNLTEPLKRAFGYQYVKYVDSYTYAPADWLEMMRTELYDKRPILYTAFNMWISGHAFVVDGLDENGFFHVHWAFNGSYDGYFRLDVLNYNEPPKEMTPEGMEAGFFANHQALLLCPDAVQVNHPDTLTRTGHEIVIDSITIDQQPETDKHSQITLYCRNTTDQHLTTPFEFFTNLPSDTAIFEQADFTALCGTVLKPYEKKKMVIHANFNKEGERLLRVSPDGKIVVYECPVTITKGKAPQLNFHIPEISFPEKSRAFVTLTVNNDTEAGRCGQEVLYEMGPGKASVMKDGVRHSRHLYVMPGETLKDTVSFNYMVPGQTYTLLIRSPWKVVTQTTFIMPEVSGIENSEMPDGTKKEKWYSIDGREIAFPQSKGLYLHQQGNKRKKIYFK